MKMKETIQGIGCPILFDRLLTLKTPCKYNRKNKVKAFNEITMSISSVPKGIAGAIAVHPEKVNTFKDVVKGDNFYWMDYEYKTNITVYTPIYERGVRITLSWKPYNEATDLSKEGWTESDLCPSIKGWVRVTARAEGNLSTSLEIPQASSIEEASASVFRFHSTVKVLGPYGMPTGEILPEDAEVPTEAGRHLVTNTSQTRWWIVDTVEVGGPPSR